MVETSCGRLVQAHANHGVMLLDGQLEPVHFPRRQGRPLVGDLVRVDAQGSLVEILPRSSLFGRGDERGRFQPLVANASQAAIVLAPEPAPSPDLPHRYLVSSLLHGLKPLLVLNKSDLPLPNGPPFSELELLQDIGVTVIRTRCKPVADLSALQARLHGAITVLAGQSGVGKTSLLNQLLPDLESRTSALSRVTGKGRHTTTSATAHPWGETGWIIDTPGVWEYSLWAMPQHELEQGFPEFARVEDACRFRDCSHDNEPGCAILAAVHADKIPPARHAAWLRLLAEQKRLAARANRL